jgi:hypothetical protein
MLSREDEEILRKEKGIGLYPERTYKDGGQIKIKKVAKALHKASGLHKQQAKTLDSIKKAGGGMIDMTKMKYV